MPASPYDDLARPPLHAQALRSVLVVPGSPWTALDVVEETRSTNADLVRRAQHDAGSGIVLVAEHQTAGRGRLGRTWTAPPRAGLTLSVLVRPVGVEAARWPWLPLLAGLAVAAAIRHEGDVPAGLKWPNDVVVDDRKLAGLLVERVETQVGSPAAVIGVGINVSTDRADLPSPAATSLRLEGARTTDRTILLKAVLRSLGGLLTGWLRDGGSAAGGLDEAYRQACTTLGRDVEVRLPTGECVNGRARSIDAHGRLVMDTGHRDRVFAAGEVVHVRPAT